MHPPIDRGGGGVSSEPDSTGLVRADLQDTMVGYTGGWASDTRPLHRRLAEVLTSNLLSLLVFAALVLVFMGLAVMVSR